jgi:signal-transduction protein with cAMP-binding, CBS, and nucleotidyltransferase domain
MASFDEAETVASLMTPILYTISPNDSAQSAARLMAATGAGMLPVEAPGVGTILGIVTDRDIVVSVLAKGMTTTRAVREFMTISPETCRREDSLLNAAQKMADRKLRRLVVIDDKHHAVGVIAVADIARTHEQIAGMILTKTTEPDREPANFVRAET